MARLLRASPQYILVQVTTRPVFPARWLPRAAGLPLVACVLFLSACGTSQSLNPTPLPTAAPTVTPTAQVDFAVEVTAIPTVRPRHAQPTPTSFKPPARPYIALSRSVGPPAQQVITVRGGHLPKSSPVTLAWSLKKASAPISTTVWSGKRGTLRARFTVPASPPGTYRVLALVNGVEWASAAYSVKSNATLVGKVALTQRGERITMTGQQFLPRVKLLLVAYPMSARGKPVVIGMARSDGSGAFTYTRVVPKLRLGQYVVRAWSQDAFAAEMAETYIQVVI